jgi:hypothetical protein
MSTHYDGAIDSKQQRKISIVVSGTTLVWGVAGRRSNFTLKVAGGDGFEPQLLKGFLWNNTCQVIGRLVCVRPLIATRMQACSS